MKATNTEPYRCPITIPSPTETCPSLEVDHRFGFAGGEGVHVGEDEVLGAVGTERGLVLALDDGEGAEDVGGVLQLKLRALDVRRMVRTQQKRLRTHRVNPFIRQRRGLQKAPRPLDLRERSGDCVRDCKARCKSHC